MQIENLYTVLSIIGLARLVFYLFFKIGRWAFALNLILTAMLILYVVRQSQLVLTLLYLGCPLLLINTGFYVFLHRTDTPQNTDSKYRVRFPTGKGNFQLENIKRGASVIGSAGSGKTESVVYGFLQHFRKENFCGIIHDYKDFELTEMAYPLFRDGDIPFRVISFDRIIHRVNPIAPRYLEKEEGVNEVSRVLIENLLEQRESGTTGATKFFNDAAEGLIGGLIWKLKTSYPQFCTLPHLIAIYQYLDTNSLIQFLGTNLTSRAMADAFIRGKDSERQTAGVKSTLANALKRISTQRIFMTLSADEVPLNISDEENPCYFNSEQPEI